MSNAPTTPALHLVARGTILIDRARADEDVLIRQAMAILERRMRRVQDPQALTSPDLAQRYLQLRLGTLEHEVFGVVWLDHRHRVLAIDELFRGTLDGATVHPREVVKQALRANAGACLLFHSHPSGLSEPSSRAPGFGELVSQHDQGQQERHPVGENDRPGGEEDAIERP